MCALSFIDFSLFAQAFIHLSNYDFMSFSDEKPYQCSECLKWFSTKQYRDVSTVQCCVWVYHLEL